MATMKQVKILKRPTAPAVPTGPLTPSARVSAEVSTLLEASLTRERNRLESLYRARQDALLRAISSVLNDTLERAVSTAAKRETDALVSSFAKLVAGQTAASLESGASNMKQLDEEAVAAMKKSFADAFEKSVLPEFEKSVATMLAGISGAVDLQVEEKLVLPSGGVVTALEGAADAMRDAKGAAANMDLKFDDEAADIAVVQAALDEGDVRTALLSCIGKSVAVQAKAISGVLDTNVGPEKAFEGGVPMRANLVTLAALLSMDLGDRTEARLSWLYEIVTLMDDSEEYPPDPDTIDAARRRLVGTIQKLSDFQQNGNLASSDAKHVKLLIRVLKAHLNAM